MPPLNFPIRRLAEDPAQRLDRGRWPGVLARVAQVLDQGLDLTLATIFVGEKGSGNPLSWKPMHWRMGCLLKVDLQGAATAPDPRSPYLPITCSLSAAPAPRDAATSCARKPCTASSPTSLPVHRPVGPGVVHPGLVRAIHGFIAGRIQIHAHSTLPGTFSAGVPAGSLVRTAPVLIFLSVRTNGREYPGRR